MEEKAYQYRFVFGDDESRQTIEDPEYDLAFKERLRLDQINKEISDTVQASATTIPELRFKSQRIKLLEKERDTIMAWFDKKSQVSSTWHDDIPYNLRSTAEKPVEVPGSPTPKCPDWFSRKLDTVAVNKKRHNLREKPATEIMGMLVNDYLNSGSRTFFEDIDEDQREFFLSGLSPKTPGRSRKTIENWIRAWLKKPSIPK